MQILQPTKKLTGSIASPLLFMFYLLGIWHHSSKGLCQLIATVNVHLLWSLLSWDFLSFSFDVPGRGLKYWWWLWYWYM